ncbi:MAG: ribosome silencing factor [Vicinamibacterales bacterium]
MTKSPRRPRKRPASPGLSSEVALAISAATDKKAIDLIVLDLRKAAAFTDYFIICTGANNRQVQAIADAVQEMLTKAGTKPSVIEGQGRADWILIDYFDFMVHIFTPATREFYGLERLWGDAERVEVPA